MTGRLRRTSGGDWTVRPRKRTAGRRGGRAVVVLAAVAGLLVADPGGLRAQLQSATDRQLGAVTAFTPGEGGAAETGGLDPKLANALTRAQELARTEGVELVVNSGRRSRERQQELFTEAVGKYGSAEVAGQWVLPPDESEHVTGRAVDIGPPPAASWLEHNGEQFGLCRVYENEPWHFERLAGADGATCPPLLPHA